MTSRQRSRMSWPGSPSSSGSIRTGRYSSTATSTPSAPGPSERRRPRTLAGKPTLGRPLFVLNLKTYSTSTGAAADRLATVLERLAGSQGVAAAVAPSMADLGRIARTARIPVLAQHVDPIPAGAFTGQVSPASLKAAGVRGSLVNHSERPLEEAAVRSVVKELSELGLVAVVCARTVREAQRLARWRPPYLAIEPPELIGGQRAVSTARPEIVADAVRLVRRVSPHTEVLCGAGIHSPDDVRAAFELGSSGVLVASAVTRARNPRQVLERLLSGFKAA